MISQTVQFMGCNARRLYDAYLSSADHAAMTVDGTQAATFRRGSQDVAQGGVGDELRAFGMPGTDGQIVYGLRATVLQLVAGRLIVLSWRNKAWDCAIDPGDVSDLPSTVVLTFRDNIAGAEIVLGHVNIPDYKAKIPETGEVGPLSQLVNTHWSLLYWEPMRHYFAPKP
jgi:Activator of Hsp90 ATPase homolog 1-like protein